MGFEMDLDPPVPALGQIFRVTTFVFDPRNGRLLQRGALSLDAIMPDHGHGMETRPVHRPSGTGRFVTEGMKLHMPGLWRVEVEARGELDGREVEDRAVVVYQQPIVVP